MGCFVVVHGAFEGGWSFGRLARAIRRAGHEAWTPTLTGCGERFHLLTREVRLETHVQDVVSMLEHEDLREVILVGHSYGGTVVTIVADRCPERVAQVVYLDSTAPAQGQTSTGAMAQGTDEVLQAMSEASDDSWLLPPIPLTALGITEAADVAFFDARRHPHPLRTLHEPVRLSGRGDGIPRAYIAFEDHATMVELFGADPLAPFAERARREGWDFQSLPGAHDAAYCDPERVASALLSYVR